MMCCSLNPATTAACSMQSSSPFMWLNISRWQGQSATCYHRRPSLPPLPSFLSPPLPSATTLGARAVPRPERFIGQLSEERLLPRGLLARAWLVDSFSISGVLFDMSFKSFKELGVSAERLGSFCKRWMARVQRSGCFLSSPSISLFPPPSFLQLFLLSLSLSFIGWYQRCQLTKLRIWLCFVFAS